MQGRPLRFLALTLCGWTGLRTVMLWPTPPIAEPLGNRSHQATARPAAVAARAPVLIELAAIARPAVPIPAAWVAVPPRFALAPTHSAHAMPYPAPSRPSPAPDAAEPAGQALTPPPPTVPTPYLVLPPSPATPSPSRFAGSAWFVVRQGVGDSLAFGQLGASQGGVRVTYRLRRGLALASRISAPLHGRGREAAIGIDWQPTRWPVHLLAEQRVDLETGGTRPAVEAVAAASTALPLGLALDAYGQAGAVAGRGGFVDGAAHLSRSIVDLGAARLDAGAGVWGGAQRGAERLDVGPSVGITIPAALGGVRLSLDYRLRITGRAAPGSGPALTLGTNF